MLKNGVTDVTRRHISDEMTIGKLWYHGNQAEPDFLARIFDLKSLPSRDYRYTNAYDDIYQHMVNNNDWDADWIYSDPRINMAYCDDEIYMKFLCTTVHPRVRTNVEEVSKLVEIFNKHLSHDGYEIVKTDEISGRPVFSGGRKAIGQARLEEKRAEIKRYLNTAYVNGKISTMTVAIASDTDLAIGIAKELLETTCKSILRQKQLSNDSDLTLSQLLKVTTKALDFTPKDAENPEKAERAIRQILSGVGTIVQGVGELRNGYGSGHGKDADFKGLEEKYARLLVGLVSEVVVLYLVTNGETAELFESDIATIP